MRGLLTLSQNHLIRIMKKGRKPKKHKPVEATFDQVLDTVGRSKYKDKKTLKKEKEKERPPKGN